MTSIDESAGLEQELRLIAETGRCDLHTWSALIPPLLERLTYVSLAGQRLNLISRYSF